MRTIARNFVAAALVVAGMLAGAAAANAAPNNPDVSTAAVSPAQVHADAGGRMHPMAPADWWW